MIGTTISHYRIIEKLGEGGMGIVYKAQDTTLDRLVALKFLPPHVSTSSEDKARFIQEAKAAASLSHPNICTIHGVEDHDGKAFIVMEFVEGKTLKDMKEHIPLKQAIEIGIQLADGLAAAHEKGIVHRDIKPENIMIRKDGRVQIMDFGLAKLKGVSRLTKEGSTVGTAGYMSPEQVQGLETDHRTDIFSMGVVLYELFAGESPFKGVHETAISYEIVNVDPQPISSLKPDINPELDGIVLDCLAKEPAERSQSAAEVAKDLRHVKRESSKARASRVTVARPAYMQPVAQASEISDRGTLAYAKRFLPWILCALLFLSLAIVVVFYAGNSSNELFEVRALIPPPEKTNFYSYGVEAGPVVVSPDGRMLAFVAMMPDGKSMLYLRSLRETSAQPLPGTEYAYYSFWSPDSKWIGFFAGGKLKKVDIAGSPPETICEVASAKGATWSKDGTILFARDFTEPISSVSAAGGKPAIVTKLDRTRNESSHRWPYALPDGKHFLYFSRTSSFGGGAAAEGDALFVASLDFKTNKKLLNTSANAVYTSGYLLFMRGSTLFAQVFDESSLELRGDPFPIAEGVINDQGFNLAVFSASQNGVLAYQTGTAQSGARMMIVDRAGRELSLIGDVAEYNSPRLSSDGRRLVVSLFDSKLRRQNLWLYDLTRNSGQRFTTEISTDVSPVWSPKDLQIAYLAYSRTTGDHRIYVRPSEGSGIAKDLYASKEGIGALDWSYDGKYIAFVKLASGTGNDIWVLPLSGDRKPNPYLQSQFNEDQPRFSRDGQCIAYISNETGQDEVYIRPFPGPGKSVKVSTAGGQWPVWNQDGKELYYVSPDHKTMAAQIRSKGSSLESGSVSVLFTRPREMSSEYDVFPGGKRFLLKRFIEPKETDPITIVVNWNAGLKKK